MVSVAFWEPQSALAAPPVLVRFGPNPDGRDFVVGDIHGMFQHLEVLLRDIGFDEQRDRLFSVGDLVDRGPSSALALDWLAKPWFVACRGNHEQFAIDSVDPNSSKCGCTTTEALGGLSLGRRAAPFQACFRATATRDRSGDRLGRCWHCARRRSATHLLGPVCRPVGRAERGRDVLCDVVT